MTMKDFLIVLAGLIAMMAMAKWDVDQGDKANENYCEMVGLYKQTGGENGWPDYHGNYEEVCK